MQLITKAKCKHCATVKEYLASTGKIVEILELDQDIPVKDTKYGKYSSTVPLLLGDWWFVNGKASQIIATIEIFT